MLTITCSAKARVIQMLDVRETDVEIVEGKKPGQSPFAVELRGSPIRYYDNRALAEAFVDGLRYLHTRD